MYYTIEASDLEGPSTQYLRSLFPILLRVWLLEPEASNIGYLDPLGRGLFRVCSLGPQSFEAPSACKARCMDGECMTADDAPSLP